MKELFCHEPISKHDSRSEDAKIIIEKKGVDPNAKLAISILDLLRCRGEKVFFTQG
jgi:DNA-binding XRE family transcriptional regulator